MWPRSAPSTLHPVARLSHGHRRQLRLTDAAEEANEKHLKPWTELLKVWLCSWQACKSALANCLPACALWCCACRTLLVQEFGIEGTPLSPYVDVELLRHNHLFVDGSKIEATGFSYEVPTVRAAVPGPLLCAVPDARRRRSRRRRCARWWRATCG